MECIQQCSIYIYIGSHIIAYIPHKQFAIVKKRIDRTQSRLDKVTNQELLLEAAHALRIVKDRQKELEGQLEQQIKDIHRCETVLWSIVYSFILHLI